jgi:hypothetical protein
MRYYFTHLLYARPSFLEGMARIVDFGNTLNEFNDCPTPEEADWRAIESDWRAVGADMEWTIRTYERASRKPGNAQKSSTKGERSIKQK